MPDTCRAFFLCLNEIELFSKMNFASSLALIASPVRYVRVSRYPRRDKGESRNYIC